MRHEIEIALMTLNGNKFIGTITPQEAKFIIYKESLGFTDFTNFDGVRFAFMGVPVVVFKLKTAINIDELIGIQNFEFKRTSTCQGKVHHDTIGCKIKGLRDHTRCPIPPQYPLQGGDLDDGTREIKIYNCEYRVQKQTLVDFLGHYGVLVSDIVEELFEDGGTGETEAEGTNRTGTYVAKVQLRVDIPELVPIEGRRIRINYPGVRVLCTKCFGKHHKTKCESRKRQFKDYVLDFAAKNLDYPISVYGRWIELIRAASAPVVPDAPVMAQAGPNTDQNLAVVVLPSQSLNPDTATAQWLLSNSPQTQTQEPAPMAQTQPAETQPDPNTTPPPTQRDYKVPTNQFEHNQVVAGLVSGGSSQAEAEQVIASRKTAFNKAMKDYKKERKQSFGKKQTRSSKNAAQRQSQDGN